MSCATPRISTPLEQRSMRSNPLDGKGISIGCLPISVISTDFGVVARLKSDKGRASRIGLGLMGTPPQMPGNTMVQEEKFPVLASRFADGPGVAGFGFDSPIRPVRGVQSALLLIGQLPPPASGADLLAGLDSPRARGAPDGGEAPVVQAVVGDIVLAHVLPDVIQAPIGEGVQLQQAEGIVRLQLVSGAACHRLVAPQSRDPGLQARESPSQRLHLADGAAFLAIRNALPEGEEPLLLLQP